MVELNKCGYLGPIVLWNIVVQIPLIGYYQQIAMFNVLWLVTLSFAIRHHTASAISDIV